MANGNLIPYPKGVSGNPKGRPKGAGKGRAGAVAVLDKLLSKSTNRQKLRDAMQGALDKAPLSFFRDFVMPLVPKESLVTLDQQQPAAIRIMFDADAVADAAGEAAAAAKKEGE